MRFFYPLIYALGQWRPVGVGGWEGYGGENLAAIAALDGASVWLYVWDSDARAWSGGRFDASAAAAARPKVVVSAIQSSGMAADTANVDSLLWSMRKYAINAAAARRGLMLQDYSSAFGLYPSRNVYTTIDAQNWLATVG